MNLEEEILIDHFLRNELSKEEQEAFLKRIDVDQDFREKFLMEKQLFETLDEKDWSHATNIDQESIKKYTKAYANDAERIKKVIQTASSKYNNKKQGKGNVRRLLQISSIAAIVIIGLLIGFYYSRAEFVDHNVLYAEYIDATTLPSLVTRNTEVSNTIITVAEDYYRNGKYEQAITEYDKLLGIDKDNGFLYLYKAKSYLKLKKYQEAEKTLDSLINSNLIDAEKGYWFKALLYLKTEDLEKCNQMLATIIDNSYFNHQKAKELKQKINDYKD